MHGQKKKCLFAGLAAGRTGEITGDLESLWWKNSVFCRMRCTAPLKNCAPALRTAEQNRGGHRTELRLFSLPLIFRQRRHSGSGDRRASSRQAPRSLQFGFAGLEAHANSAPRPRFSRHIFICTAVLTEPYPQTCPTGKFGTNAFFLHRARRVLLGQDQKEWGVHKTDSTPLGAKTRPTCQG